MDHLSRLDLNNNNLLKLLLFFTLFRVRNNNCSIDLQTTIILFTCNVSSHKTDWILAELPLPALSCLLYLRVSSLMNAVQEECLCLREISINVNKLLLCCCCLFTCWSAFFFILILLIYFCLFVNYVNKPIVLFLKLLFISLITLFS